MLTTKTAFYDATRMERAREFEGMRLASFGSRVAALLIDFLLAAVLFLGVGALIIAGVKYIPAARDWQEHRHVVVQLNFFHNWYSVLYLAAFFGLSLYWGRGRTLGKRLMKIRVVPLYHERLSLWHCIERALGYGASALELGFGFLQYFAHPNRQTVHDRIAETIVVYERR